MRDHQAETHQARRAQVQALPPPSMPIVVVSRPSAILPPAESWSQHPFAPVWAPMHPGCTLKNMAAYRTRNPTALPFSSRWLTGSSSCKSCSCGRWSEGNTSLFQLGRHSSGTALHITRGQGET
ncbi:TPA: hypothetical protein ACH3X1_012377 [Trebouxia sp. C0004]